MTQTTLVVALALIAQAAYAGDVDTSRDASSAGGPETPAQAPLRGTQVTVQEGVIVLPPAIPARSIGGPLIIEVPVDHSNVPSEAVREEGRRPAAQVPLAESRPDDGEETTAVSGLEAGSGSGEPGTPEVIGGASHRVILEARDPGGRIVQVVRDESGALMEIVRDPDGSLVSARGLTSGE
jgi:hypothetical protein